MQNIGTLVIMMYKRYVQLTRLDLPVLLKRLRRGISTVSGSDDGQT